MSRDDLDFNEILDAIDNWLDAVSGQLKWLTTIFMFESLMYMKGGYGYGSRV